MDIFTYFGLLVDIGFGLVGGISQLNIGFLLVRGFVGLLWVGIGNVSSSVRLSIGIGIGTDTV